MVAMGASAVAVLRGRSRAERALCAAVTAALVLWAGMEIHPAAESHDAAACLSGHAEIYFPAASHPFQVAHAEAARPAERPQCAVCLNRIQSTGASFGQTGHLPAARAERAQLLPVTSFASDPCPGAAGARAPPLA
jgi:hypothetical protein